MFVRSVTLLMLAATALASCTGETKSGSEPLALEPASLPGQVANLQDWDSLSSDVRHAIVEGDYRRVKDLTMTPRQRLNALTDPKQRQLADTMVNFMKKNGDLTVKDPHRGRIGDVETWAELLLLPGNVLAAGRITFEQPGCDLPDDSGRSFPTAAAAKSAGCITNGGAWRAYGSFNHDGTPFEYSDFMAWGGGDAP